MAMRHNFSTYYATGNTSTKSTDECTNAYHWHVYGIAYPKCLKVGPNRK